MKAAQCHILLVSGDKDNCVRLQAALREQPFDVTTARPETALAALRKSRFDALVLDFGESFVEGPVLERLKEIFLQSPEVPILAVVSGGEDSAVIRALRDGISSYLSIDDLQSDRFREALDFAVRRPNRKSQGWAARKSETDARSGGVPLSRSEPETFRELVARYDALLEASLDRKTYRGDGQRNDTEALARQLGHLDAGPRDVIDVHTAALKRKYDPEQPSRYQAYAQEARFLLLELMGYLVGFYRGRTVTAAQAPVEEETADHG